MWKAISCVLDKFGALIEFNFDLSGGEADGL